jgi:hypothetical protein
VPRDVKRARYKDKLRRDHTNPKPSSPPASPKSRSDEGGKSRGDGGGKKKDEE